MPNERQCLKLVAKIDKTRKQGNSSSAVRLFVLDCVRMDKRVSRSRAQRVDAA